MTNNPHSTDAEKHDPTGFGPWAVLCGKCGMDVEQMKASLICRQPPTVKDDELVTHAKKMREALCGDLPNGVGNTMDALFDRITDLQTRLERYETALRTIADHDGVSYRFGDEVRAIARKALGDRPNDFRS